MKLACFISFFREVGLHNQYELKPELLPAKFFVSLVSILFLVTVSCQNLNFSITYILHCQILFLIKVNQLLAFIRTATISLHFFLFYTNF